MSDEPARPPAPSKIAPPSILSRPSDAPPRPGFRAPPNKGTKAQKTAKGKKK
jgi:hypothetical protein